MREMVLNHASVFAPRVDRESIVQWLEDLTGGMAVLISARVTRNSLRMARTFHDTVCQADYSLSDASSEMRALGFRDEYMFLLRLATKLPLLNDVGEEVEDRFRACEERTLKSPLGEPLVFCAITNGIAVDFPSAPEWDRDEVTVHFDELRQEGAIEPRSEEIDQLTRSEHAKSICARHRYRLRAVSNPVTLWENRAQAFPNLAFGPGVEDDLRRSAHRFSAIVRKLDDLDTSVGDWVVQGGATPSWRTKVTPESS